MTLEEYEKVLEEKKKALQATKVEERKVDTKAFESMQQLSSKKSNNDDVFIKLVRIWILQYSGNLRLFDYNRACAYWTLQWCYQGTEKDKRTVEREEKAKKVSSLVMFLPI